MKKYFVVGLAILSLMVTTVYALGDNNENNMTTSYGKIVRIVLEKIAHIMMQILAFIIVHIGIMKTINPIMVDMLIEDKMDVITIIDKLHLD